MRIRYFDDFFSGLGCAGSSFCNFFCNFWGFFGVFTFIDCGVGEWVCVVRGVVVFSSLVGISLSVL